MIQLLNILHTYDSLFMCLLLTCVVGWVKRLSRKALFTWADVHYATLFIFILHGVCLNVPVVLVLFVVVLFLMVIRSCKNSGFFLCIILKISNAIVLILRVLSEGNLEFWSSVSYELYESL